jgi:hypothetical protein
MPNGEFGEFGVFLLFFDPRRQFIWRIFIFLDSASDILEKVLRDGPFCPAQRKGRG